MLDKNGGVTKDTPLYSNPELREIAEKINGIEHDLAEKEKVVEELKSERLSFRHNLRKLTYHWLLNYQLKVNIKKDYDGTERDSWFFPNELNDPENIQEFPKYRGGFKETEKDCMDEIEQVKDKIKKRVGENVLVLALKGTAGFPGVITEHNIGFIVVTKGEEYVTGVDHNVVFKYVGERKGDKE